MLRNIFNPITNIFYLHGNSSLGEYEAGRNWAKSGRNWLIFHLLSELKSVQLVAFYLTLPFHPLLLFFRLKKGRTLEQVG